MTFEDLLRVTSPEEAGVIVDATVPPASIRPITPLPARPTDIDEIIDLLVAYGMCQ